jgi:hypothetical protein
MPVADNTHPLAGVMRSLEHVEYVWGVYFLFDYLLRVLFYPNLRYFFLDVINVTDGVALLSGLVNSFLRTEGDPDCVVDDFELR